MFAFVQYLKAVAQQIINSDSAQDAFEYLLVIGGVSVAIIIAMTTPIGENLIEAVVTGVCNAIDGIGGATLGLEVDCSGILGTGTT